MKETRQPSALQEQCAARPSQPTGQPLFQLRSTSVSASNFGSVQVGDPTPEVKG